MNNNYDFSLPQCDCSRGAPMGRMDEMARGTGETLRARRVYLDSGGYDKGGAYWGLGKPLYLVSGNDGSRCFERAGNRRELAALLRKRFPDAKLAGFPRQCFINTGASYPVPLWCVDVAGCASYTLRTDMEAGAIAIVKPFERNAPDSAFTARRISE